MNPNDPNIALVEIVAKALAELREQLVFVGGCATGLLITDPARPSVRSTQDVDLITEVVSVPLKNEVDDLLAEKNFVDTLSWHLGPDAASQARGELIIDRLRKIAGL